MTQKCFIVPWNRPPFGNYNNKEFGYTHYIRNLNLGSVSEPGNCPMIRTGVIKRPGICMAITDSGRLSGPTTRYIEWFIWGARHGNGRVMEWTTDRKLYYGDMNIEFYDGHVGIKHIPQELQKNSYAKWDAWRDLKTKF